MPPGCPLVPAGACAPPPTTTWPEVSGVVVPHAAETIAVARSRRAARARRRPRLTDHSRVWVARRRYLVPAAVFVVQSAEGPGPRSTARTKRARSRCVTVRRGATPHPGAGVRINGAGRLVVALVLAGVGFAAQAG